MWSGAEVPPVSCPLLEGDGLLKLEMLDIAEKDTVAPAPASAPSSHTPEPEEKKQITLQVPKEPCNSEPEEVAHLVEGLDVI